MSRSIALLALAVGAAVAKFAVDVQGDDQCANAPFAQCGGDGWTGDTCCSPGYNCTFSNEYYSGCSPEDLCLTVQYGQCAGTVNGEPLPKENMCCPPSFECEFVNQYFSQCVEKGTNSTDCSPAYGQCGGDGWEGYTCCIPGYSCEVDNEFYSGCQPIPVCQNAAYGQCGGVDTDGQPWTVDHTTCCPDGFKCEYNNQYFSQCCPNPGGCN
jgi:hypothetical protein